MDDESPRKPRQTSWPLSGTGPLYHQLHQYIAGAIETGAIKAGDNLPAERDIAELCGISRVTVRKALQSLVEDGIVVQRRGSGNSVARTVERVDQSLSRLTSFSEDMKRRGKTARSMWIERGIFAASPEEMMVLGLRADAQVARLTRLRIADDIPLAIERASLSTRYLPDPDRVETSLYETLAQDGNKPVRATQRISALNLPKEEAQFLEVPLNSAGLKIERVSYSSLEQVVEFTRTTYRAEAYDFVAELQLAEGT
jgi:GntR family transcriptional regulator